jgi:hypothetical protein
MRKEGLILIILGLFLMPFATANCELGVSMINQDPYPAIPGDYVKVVFQIDGVENPECGIVGFEIKENYPFSLDPGTTNRITINAGTYSKSYSSFYLATYKLRVGEDALEGNNPIEVAYSGNGAEFLEEFDIYVEDTRADFEVNIKDYDYGTKTLTFEILNIEDVDIEALTIEIPKQENIIIKGANKKVVGDLDSNEYTTADFEAVPSNGEIELNIIYTDAINVRRELTKNVTFDSSYFQGRNGSGGTPFGKIFIGILVIVVIWFFWRRHKKHKEKKRQMAHHNAFHHEEHSKKRKK